MAAPLPGYATAMSEASTEGSEADRLEQVQGMDPDPGLAEAIGPEPVPVSAEQLAAGRDAVPADPDEQGTAAQLAEESHDDGGPGDQHSG